MIEQKTKTMTVQRASFVSLLLILLLLPNIQAQNGTSSPFSMFGIGEIEMRDFGRTTAMGSVGIGLQSENFLNRRNPAALGGIDTLRFILDVSAAMKFSEFSTAANSGRSNDFSFKSIAVGVRLSKRWTSSVGLTPYSNVGYQMKSPIQIQGTKETENAVYSGNGGVNKFYWANAYELFQGFSLGVTSSYLFGNFTHTAEESMITIENIYNVNKIHFDFGMQYLRQFGEHTAVTIGGIYSYKANMPIEHMRLVTTPYSTERNQRFSDIKSFIPETYGAGFSILRNKNAAEWVFAADYQFQNWSVNPMTHETLTFSDSHTYSAGLQFTPNQRPENYLQFIRFMVGASYNQSYLKVNGYQSNDYSLSFGVGLPFYNQMRRTVSYVNVAVNVGEWGTGQRGGVTERYVLFSVNMSLIERWFAKRQWD